MEKALNNNEVKQLFKAIALLKTSRECKNFMRDLCTLAELKKVAERWQVAQQINKGTQYRKIAKQTGASTATVTRVAHWLHHGMGGYKLALQRLK